MPVLTCGRPGSRRQGARRGKAVAVRKAWLTLVRPTVTYSRRSGVGQVARARLAAEAAVTVLGAGIVSSSKATRRALPRLSSGYQQRSSDDQAQRRRHLVPFRLLNFHISCVNMTLCDDAPFGTHFFQTIGVWSGRSVRIAFRQCVPKSMSRTWCLSIVIRVGAK